MPPKKSSTEGESLNEAGSAKFSTAEVNILTTVLANMTNTPEINWDKAAEDLGSASAASVRERFRQIKKKFGWDSNTFKVTSAKKTKDAATSTETPTKVKKATGRVGAKKGKAVPKSAPIVATTPSPAVSPASGVSPDQFSSPTPAPQPMPDTVDPSMLVGDGLSHYMGGDLGWVSNNGSDVEE
ncbi:hypothetical protein GQ53DRAFT_884746 [Thozetella sp. PMI_491]|nr:hypothetical protein GQ53DRAFT_884746 [Thozetella sp. PMI_491]